MIAVEANPLLAHECSERFADAAGTMPFYVNDQLSEWSSFNHRIGTSRGPHHVIQVPTTTLADLIERHGMPYHAKPDIEGMDLAALVSLRRLAEKPKYPSLENGPGVMIDELHFQGCRRFKFINQAHIHTLKLPTTAREGLHVDHSFPRGASGPFGEDTEGPWLDREAVTAQSDAYWKNPNRDDNIHGWYDLHAAL